MFIDLPKIFSYFIVLQCFGIFVLSEIPRLRGVSISRSNLYAPADTFKCLDGKRTIRYNQLNDDFCDCDDGSDEPGTSACPNGIFHCTNAGHRPQNIPSSRVNDGICDCCDKSDEYASSVQCINNCSELGREEKQREKEKADLAKQGNQLRSDMSSKGKLLKDEQKQRLAELDKTIEQAVAVKNEKENIKLSVESAESAALDIYRETENVEKKKREELETENNRKEAIDAFKKFDSNNDGIVELIDLQTRSSFDSNRDGEVSAEEARYFLDEHDQVDLETFITLCWPRIKPFMMLDVGLFKPPHTEGEIKEDFSEKTPEDVDVEADTTDEHAEIEGDDEEHYDEEETGEGEVQEITPQPEYDEETKKLIEEANEARNQFNTAERELRELESERKNIEELLSKDFGPNEEYAILNGECINFEEREYIYKLCPFDRVIQQPRNGGGETR